MDRTRGRFTAPLILRREPSVVVGAFEEEGIAFTGEVECALFDLLLKP
jgi:hypothetical protein